MKRILSVALALSLLSGTAAAAAPYGHGGYGSNHGYAEQYRGNTYRGYHRGHGDAGAAIAVGVGLLALTAIIASQNRDQDRMQDRGDYRNRDYGRGQPGYEQRGYDQPGYDQSGYDNNGYGR